MTSEQLGAAVPLARAVMTCSARLRQWARFTSADRAGPVTGRQAQVIAALQTTSSPSVVASALGVTPAVVTGLMDRLEAQGLVQRAIRGHDRRAWVLEVTEAGIAARDQLLAQQLATLAAALPSFSDEELRMVVETLTWLERLIELDE